MSAIRMTVPEPSTGPLLALEAAVLASLAVVLPAAHDSSVEP
jgi:hypothetical protein